MIYGHHNDTRCESIEVVREVLTNSVKAERLPVVVIGLSPRLKVDGIPFNYFLFRQSFVCDNCNDKHSFAVIFTQGKN